MFGTLIDAILEQVKRASFQAMFADGHGPSRNAWCAGMAARETCLDTKLFGVTAQWSTGWRSQIDHAAANEISLVMAVRPDLSDLTQLAEDRSVWTQGVSGEDPSDATADHGEHCLSISMEIVKKMLTEAGV